MTVTFKGRTQCVYCDQIATTMDHVPPKCFFTPPMPRNLVTVPACAACNNGASNDDAEFRNQLYLMTGSFGESANAAGLRGPSLRAIRRDRRALARTVRGARLIGRYSKGGIFLGWGVAVPAPPEARERVLIRIVRGLVWHHFCIRVNASCVGIIHIDKSKPTWQQTLDEFPSKPDQCGRIGDGATFEYRYTGDDDPTMSAWLMTFFRGPSAYIVIGHTIRDGGAQNPSIRDVSLPVSTSEY